MKFNLNLHLVATPSFVLPRSPSIIHSGMVLPLNIKPSREDIVVVDKPIPTPVSNNMLNSDPNGIALQSFDINSNFIVEPTSSIKSNNINAVDSSVSKPLEVEITEVDGKTRVTLHSIIPNGFAIADNEKFEGKKIIATKGFKAGEVLYIGHAALLDLSDMGNVFKLRVYEHDEDTENNFMNGVHPNRRFLNEYDNSATHSVDDHADGSKSDSTSKRQVRTDVRRNCTIQVCFHLTIISMIIY